jgi:glycosyltransferase involved in cell wall biosynthesis
MKSENVKIVFWAPFGIRPKGTLIARMLPLAVALQSLGHQVVIVAPPYTNPEDSGREEDVAGVRIVNITLTSLGLALGAPVLAWRMLRAMLREKPDLVHLFKPKGFGGLAAIFIVLLRWLGMAMPSLFVDSDDWEGRGGMEVNHSYSFLERHLFRFQESWIPGHAAGVTVASRTMQTQAWGLGVAPERVCYLPNCVEDAPLGNGEAVRKRLGIPPAAPVLLLYTRFFEFAQEKLHEIFAEVHRRLPEARFLVVGRGRHGEEALLVRAGEEKGFTPALIMGGWLEPSEIPDCLAAADVAIYPFADTLINRSKCPAKLTELLRAGVPVVADNVGQLAEYIKPGVSGVLCEPEDWQEMVERAVELLVDSTRGKELGRSGREYLLDKFSWQGYAERLDGFYRLGLGRCNGGDLGSDRQK